MARKVNCGGGWIATVRGTETRNDKSRIATCTRQACLVYFHLSLADNMKINQTVSTKAP